MRINEISNAEKQNNYREQMGRLTRAMKSNFFLEAVFIEYAIIEDRLTSVLKYTEDFNPAKQNTLNKKLNKVKSIKCEKNSVLKKYISDELLNEIYEWKNNRNTIVHALLNQTVSTDELKTFAEKGQELAKKLSSKATSYKRYLERNPVVDMTLTAEQKKIFTEITDKGVLKKINTEYVTKNNITELVIPDFVKKLANGVFNGLTTVKSLKVGLLLNDFERRNLSELSQLEEISVHEKNTKFMAVNGVLYKKDKHDVSFIYYPKHKKDSEYVVPDFVTEFGNGICNDNLTSLVLPETVKRISCYYLDFNGCPNLENIVFPKSLEDSSCISLKKTKWYKENKNDFVILGGILIGYKGEESNVIIPDNVKFLDENMFDDYNENIKSITIPASVTYMYGDDIFNELVCLEEIVILSHNINADSPLLLHINNECFDFSRIYLPNKEVFYRLFDVDSIEYWCETNILPDIYIDGACYEHYDVMKLFSEENKEEIIIDYNEIAEYYKRNRADWLDEMNNRKGKSE